MSSWLVCLRIKSEPGRDRQASLSLVFRRHRKKRLASDPSIRIIRPDLGLFTIASRIRQKVRAPSLSQLFRCVYFHDDVNLFSAIGPKSRFLLAPNIIYQRIQSLLITISLDIKCFVVACECIYFHDDDDDDDLYPQNARRPKSARVSRDSDGFNPASCF